MSVRRNGRKEKVIYGWFEMKNSGRCQRATMTPMAGNDDAHGGAGEAPGDHERCDARGPDRHEEQEHLARGRCRTDHAHDHR
jgi:hypothetical protein